MDNIVLPGVGIPGGMHGGLPGGPGGQGGPGGPGGPGGQGPAPLPPQMFTTSSQLLDLTDKKLLVALRDGRKFIGVLRTWDQYANLVLQSTVERIIVDDIYCDIPRGVFIVRGENVLLLGEIDLDKEDQITQQLAPVEQVYNRQHEIQRERKRKEKISRRRLLQEGFENETEITVL
ncbi:small nuclear ribonucleoprotein [Peziza echinospora]|nr:small nuclear ribonucleoprotein [Peziza echinospora]